MSQMTLGVMALYLNGNRIEERAFFSRLLSEAKKMDIDAYVFTPEDVNGAGTRIYAHVYDTKRSVWTRSWREFPDVVFDRCRYQNTPRFKKLREFRAKYGNLLYMNRPLANKWAIHQLLWKDEAIRKSLPVTAAYREQELAKFTRTHPVVFVKPINGTGGRGVICIKRLGKDMYSLRGRDKSRRILPTRRTSLSGVQAALRRLGLTNGCLMQQGIDLTLPSGRVHDYRLLMQKNGDGAWEASGCAGRIGAARSVTSNLHGGGKAVRVQRLLRVTFPDAKRAAEVESEVHSLGMRVVKRLESHFKEMCELALDVAVDRNGRAWLLEVNPKPAREVFRMIGERETYRKAIVRPLEYALYLYQSSKKKQKEEEA
ncbi:YheC/YheD family endospore coat-associated protein [Paenibacillus alkalitolerans]|uniref:YheC/YheD family endospore coat-associated protein n=1 Tax=Paenibacillus alkalitolerans TaxID=2799335 RepID=UPI0018F7BA6F|nr:YheC/YheD family protein [Paenibacillus alkalitolerans]